MGGWVPAIEHVKLRVNYTVPVEIGDKATLEITINTKFLVPDPPVCEVEVQLFSLDNEEKTIEHEPVNFVITTVGNYQGVAETFRWELPVSKPDEDGPWVKIGSKTVFMPFWGYGRDEVFVKARKTGGGIQPSDWTKSNTVKAHFGWLDGSPRNT